MVGLLTWKCARGNLNGGVDTGIIDIAVDIDVYRATLDRISCHGEVKGFPGGVVCTGGLASEGIWFIWFHRYTVLPSVHMYYSSV